ncbi:hypothetical protein M3P21_21095 [Ruegeria sp. 2012CJ41-6]|uniref:Uncharacterized protein n=1 Tax=Ruegeria spongiae TaxID=2942209 RepID=A0ABT0Q812_9RHOB|nr:hypothetical protein [Ruegeria spongiae]MCL6286016.1 hypothetical protein [Ruegeria spongiae]
MHTAGSETKEAWEPLGRIEKPTRIVFRDEDLMNLSPEHQAYYQEPAQWWRHRDLEMQAVPVFGGAAWWVSALTVPEIREDYVKAVRETLHEIMRSTNADLILCEVIDGLDDEETLSRVEEVGFRRLGEIPLSSGSRTLFGWRPYQ